MAVPVLGGITSSNGVQTSVASSASSVILLMSNPARKGATVYNDSTQILYVLLGAGALGLSTVGSLASTSIYTVQLAPNAYYECPFGFTGLIQGIWAAANGNARITELT